MRATSKLNLFVSALAVAVAVASAFGETISLPALRDGFVRQEAPTLNFGGAGNLCVAGADSVNADGDPRGRFDSLIEFDPEDAIATLNNTYGPGGWNLASIELSVSELGAPQNPNFPRGVGTARCAWLPLAPFTEGIGTPNAPVIGTGDDLTWNHLQSLLAGSTESVLGEFANFGVNGTRVCALPLNGPFAQSLRGGQVVTLHLAPVTPALGFTFISRNFFDPLLRPQLILIAEPIVTGDLNCDNQLNTQDLSSFVLALVDPGAYAATIDCDIQRADLDGNGAIDGRDISKMVAALIGS